jgi:hypothetical protein
VKSILATPGFVKIDATYMALREAIYKAPVIVRFKTVTDFFTYDNTKGVYNPEDCTSDITTADLNHVMLAIGYGYLGPKEYFLVQNSWGTTWGYDGVAYIYADRTSTVGTCGLYLDNYQVLSNAPDLA